MDLFLYNENPAIVAGFREGKAEEQKTSKRKSDKKKGKKRRKSKDRKVNGKIEIRNKKRGAKA